VAIIRLYSLKDSSGPNPALFDPVTSGFNSKRCLEVSSSRFLPRLSVVTKKFEDISSSVIYLSSIITTLPTPGRIKFLRASHPQADAPNKQIFDSQSHFYPSAPQSHIYRSYLLSVAINFN